MSNPNSSSIFTQRIVFLVKHKSCLVVVELIDLKRCQQKSVIFVTTIFLLCLFHLPADPCHNYQNLSDASRKSSYATPEPGPELCDNQLHEGWYRFVGGAGTKMPTTRVPAYRCGTAFSGWLDDTHPTVEDGNVHRKVCFSRHSSHCKSVIGVLIKNCGSFFIYKLRMPPSCNLRYCGTD